MEIPYYEIHLLVERAEINYIIGYDNKNRGIPRWIDKINKWLDSQNDEIKKQGLKEVNELKKRQ
jgi:hypothetical protein